MNPRPPRHPSTQWNEAQGAQTLATWRRLLPLGPPQHYPEKTTIFTQGDKPRDICFLARGIAKLTCDLPDGQHSLFALRYPGHILEECAYDLKLPYPVSAITVTAATGLETRLSTALEPCADSVLLRLHGQAQIRHSCTTQCWRAVPTTSTLVRPHQQWAGSFIRAQFSIFKITEPIIRKEHV